jgi:hypothetical protein
MLLNGAETWNGWRAANPGIPPDLSGQVVGPELFQRRPIPANMTAFDFSRSDLSRCEFIDIALQGADFTGAVLRDTSFGHGTSLLECTFTNATFSNPSFELCQLARCAFQADQNPIRSLSFRRAAIEDCAFGAERIIGPRPTGRKCDGCIFGRDSRIS